MFGKISLGISSSNNQKPRPDLQNRPKFPTPTTTVHHKKAQTNLQKNVHMKDLNKAQIKGSKKLPQQNSLSNKNDSDHQFHQRKTKAIQKQQKKQQIQKQNNSVSQNKNLSASELIQGSKFRILNQLLYSNSSEYAMSYFKDNQEDYNIYHQGYRSQSDKWQSKPVNSIIKFFRKHFKLYKDKIICDLGCGEGFLYEELTKKKFQNVDAQTGAISLARNKHWFHQSNIHSYDLVAIKQFIKVADIKDLPEKQKTIDVVVFCLSLMGKNYLQFILEAQRILKEDTGQLIIAEVESRSKSWKHFVELIEANGFNLINNGVNLGSIVEYGHNQSKKVSENKGKYFRILHFVKDSAKMNDKNKKIRYEGETFKRDKFTQLSHELLTQCIYKKR